jgi:hypothetical protein
MKERFFEYYIVQEKHPKTGKWKELYKWFNTLDDAKAQIDRNKIDNPNHSFYFNYDKGEVPEVRIIHRVTYDEIAEIIV